MPAGAVAMPRVLTIAEEELQATVARLRYLPAQVSLDLSWRLLQVLAELGRTASEMASTALAVAELVARQEPALRATYEQAMLLLSLQDEVLPPEGPAGGALEGTPPADG